MFNVVIDLSFFVPFFNYPHLLLEMLGMVAKGNPQLVVSPLEAMGKFDLSRPVMSIDSTLDFFLPEYMTENYDRFNWLNAVDGAKVWIHPFTVSAENKNLYFSKEINKICTVYGEVFPSVSMFQRSKVFIEMNKYFIKTCPNHILHAMKNLGLIDANWILKHGATIDYGPWFDTIRGTKTTPTMNYKEVLTI